MAGDLLGAGDRAPSRVDRDVDLPFCVPVCKSGTVPAESWVGLFYLTAVSQFIGFFFYYKGLSLGGIAKMSQVQLILPFREQSLSRTLDSRRANRWLGDFRCAGDDGDRRGRAAGAETGRRVGVRRGQKRVGGSV